MNTFNNDVPMSSGSSTNYKYFDQYSIGPRCRISLFACVSVNPHTPQRDGDGGVSTSYIQSPHSIILAAVSAKGDFAFQNVTKHARKLDPEGMG